MKEEDLREFKEFPQIIESTIAMKDANSPIKIFEGEYVLKDALHEFKLVGSVSFHWLPSPETKFEGQAALDRDDLSILLSKNDSLSFIINGLGFGEALITNASFGSHSNEILIEGTISNAIFGDKSIAVEKIRFCIPNLRNFKGLPVIRTIKTNIQTSPNRLILENDAYIVNLDKNFDYDERFKSLQRNGGYNILYSGELLNKKRSLKMEESKDILHCLDTFLTFLNGRRTSALFIQGIYSEEIMWCDYTDYNVDTYKVVRTWPQRTSIHGINQLWQKFSSLWIDKEDKNFLITAIHWYVEANNNAGFLEGSIIMAQTALELLYNWWIVENKKLIIGKDSENINAANKIRLLLSQQNISYSVPNSFEKLQKFIDDSKDIIDGPDAVVQIRNAIVHSQEEKRKKLSSINYKTKSEALQLCIWYIEMSLLCILEFDDLYINRCSKELYPIKAEELVPWTKKKIKIIK